jgi:hypothetical protein
MLLNGPASASLLAAGVDLKQKEMPSARRGVCEKLKLHASSSFSRAEQHPTVSTILYEPTGVELTVPSSHIMVRVSGSKF